MKMYKRRVPMFSIFKTSIAAIFTGALYALVRWLTGASSVWTIITGALFVVLLITYTFLIVATGHKYTYAQTINLFYFGLKYKTVKYEDYSSIVICNASYNNGFGYGSGDILMKHKGEDSRVNIYPFLTLNKTDYPIGKIKSGMSSRNLFMLDFENVFCLGIAWFDSLTELLSHTSVPVYLLSDVYNRFQNEFDEVFTLSDFDFGRLYVVD